MPFSSSRSPASSNASVTEFEADIALKGREAALVKGSKVVPFTSSSSNSNSEVASVKDSEIGPETGTKVAPANDSEAVLEEGDSSISKDLGVAASFVRVPEHCTTAIAILDRTPNAYDRTSLSFKVRIQII